MFLFEILDKGDLQVSDKERQVSSETNFKELANMISDMCVNTDTKRPYSSAVIEKTLKDCHFTMKANRSIKQHVSVIHFVLSNANSLIFRHLKQFQNFVNI